MSVLRFRPALPFVMTSQAGLEMMLNREAATLGSAAQRRSGVESRHALLGGSGRRDAAKANAVEWPQA